jgi:hypothetical protein
LWCVQNKFQAMSIVVPCCGPSLSGDGQSL